MDGASEAKKAAKGSRSSQPSSAVPRERRPPSMSSDSEAEWVPGAAVEGGESEEDSGEEGDDGDDGDDLRHFIADDDDFESLPEYDI